MGGREIELDICSWKVDRDGQGQGIEQRSKGHQETCVGIKRSEMEKIGW